MTPTTNWTVPDWMIFGMFLEIMSGSIFSQLLCNVVSIAAVLLQTEQVNLWLRFTIQVTKNITVFALVWFRFQTLDNLNICFIYNVTCNRTLLNLANVIDMLFCYIDYASTVTYRSTLLTSTYIQLYWKNIARSLNAIYFTRFKLVRCTLEVFLKYVQVCCSQWKCKLNQMNTLLSWNLE